MQKIIRVSAAVYEYNLAAEQNLRGSKEGIAIENSGN